MSEKIYEVPAEWKARAFIDDAKYQAMYAQSVKDPNAFWGEQAKRIDWMKPFTKVKNTSFDPHNVSIKWFEDGATNVSYNCVDRHLAKRADQVAIIWEGDNPGHDRKITYRELHAEVQKFANVLKARGVKKGDRVTIYMPMIPEAAYAMLACTRIGAIHSVVFGGFSPDSLAGRIEDAKSTRGDRRRRRPARRQAGAAQDQRRCRRRQGRHRRDHDRGAPHRRQGSDEGRPRFLLRRDRQDRAGGMSVRADERGRSAVHSLHVRLDRKAEGRAAHHRRLSRLHVDDASIRVRLSRRRYLLVHRRRRLGDRPQLYRLWPACERRDHVDVRGRAELSVDVALLGSHRQAQGQHLLHRADRDPRADAGRRRAGEENLARLVAPARLGRRADQSGSLGVVSPRRRRWPLPDRRYLVADRNRRHSDYAAARRDTAQARLGDAAVLRLPAGNRRRRRQGA